MALAEGDGVFASGSMLDANVGSGAQINAEEHNPFCGDLVTLQIKINGDGSVGEVGHQGQGCSISQASASIMSELLKGRTLEEAQSLHARFRGIMQDQAATEADEEDLGELTALEGVKKFPIRIKCALLPWTALEEGVQEYRAKAS